MTTPGAAKGSPAATPGRDSRSSQRFGNVTGRYSPAGGPGHPEESYLVRDEDTGITYSFGSADIVAEGCRAMRTGERVRFLTDPAGPRPCPLHPPPRPARHRGALPVTGKGRAATGPAASQERPTHGHGARPRACAPGETPRACQDSPLAR